MSPKSSLVYYPTTQQGIHRAGSIGRHMYDGSVQNSMRLNGSEEYGVSRIPIDIKLIYNIKCDKSFLYRLERILNPPVHNSGGQYFSHSNGLTDRSEFNRSLMNRFVDTSQGAGNLGEIKEFPLRPVPKEGGYILVNSVLYTIKSLPTDSEGGVVVTRIDLESPSSQNYNPVESSMTLELVRNSTITISDAIAILGAAIQPRRSSIKNYILNNSEVVDYCLMPDDVFKKPIMYYYDKGMTHPPVYGANRKKTKIMEEGYPLREKKMY